MNPLNVTFFVYTICINIFTLYLYCLQYYERLNSLFFNNLYADSYDYVIVGCGTAGSLISARFFEYNISYICLEAGGLGSGLLDIPILGPLLQGSLHDWEFLTVKQENACAAMDGMMCKWPAGKIVGGSARLNNMVHLRGNLNEFVSWFGGMYDKDYFDRQLTEVERAFLPAKHLKFKTELSDAFLQAAKSLGMNIRDLNKHSDGFSETMVNQKDGARWTSFHALPRKNILPNAFVEKIIIDKVSKMAKGVKVNIFGQHYNIYAHKGVIVSSGAIGSPKLLLLSGIGPKTHLQELGIPLIKDLMVGHNLQDHVTTGLDLVLLNKSISPNIISLANPINVWKYFMEGCGPWTIPGCEAVALLNKHGQTIPELELMVIPFGVSSDVGIHFKRALGLTNHAWKNYFTLFHSKTAVSILPVVLHPKSHGYIKLRTNNPYDKPIIDPKYLTDPYDLEILLDGIDFIKKLISTDKMKALGAELNENIFPGCDNIKFDSVDYWKCYIRHFSFTSYHPGGTCKMGSAKDNVSVVGYDFKVHGIKKLYVVDASVFPSLPSSNPNTAVAMVAQIFVNNIIGSYVKEASAMVTYKHLLLNYVVTNSFCDKHV